MPDPDAQSGGIPVALIAGATGNLGREIARQFCDAGYRFALSHGHDAEKAGVVAKMCDIDGGRSLLVQGDVTADGDCRRIVDQVERSWGWSHVPVNSGALKCAASPEDVSRAVMWSPRDASHITAEPLRLDGGFHLR